MTNTEQVYFADNYVTVTAGEPFRLFKFGPLSKDGDIRHLTKDLLGKFKLPHFRPAIKLGSHRDETPAGGHIVGLEVRDDGLYAQPEFNEIGDKAIQEGHYKYLSPEVIWEGGYEDPETGNLIDGPLIVGTALLHTPHMGHNAALYSYDPVSDGGDVMSDEMITAPASWFERFFGSKVEPEPIQEPPLEPDVQVDEFNALKEERDDFETKLKEIQAEKQQADRVSYFAAEFKETELDESAELHELLASIRDEDTAEALLVQFKALSGQIVASNLTADIGSAGEGDENPSEAFHAAVKAKMEDAKVDYNSAMQMVVAETPELAQNYRIGG